jgi:hypothetical protein
MRSRCFLIAALCLSATYSFGWAEVGHRVVGDLALERLTPKAKAIISDLLQSLADRDTPENSFKTPDVFNEHPFPGIVGKFIAKPATLEDAGPWPDVIRGTWMDRPSWHYIDIPIELEGVTGEKAPDINLAAALPRLARIAEDETQSKESRAAAIAWIDHLVGDIHMPLHAVSFFDTKHPKGDRGGNDYFLDAEGKPVRENRLHGYWDRFPGDSVADAMKKVQALPAIDTPSYKLDQIGDEVMKWARESRQTAMDWAYRQAGPDSDYLSMDQSKWDEPAYRAKIAPIVDKQLQMAGVRLAGVLNAIFR